jgi:rhodanese-related sulfurtransferase
MLISPQKLKSLQANEKPWLVDVRSGGEFASGHIPGAVNIPLEELESRLDDLPVGEIVFVCQSGRRAGMACELLAQRPDLRILEGGTASWIESGGPIVASQSSTWSLERQVRFVVSILVGLGTVLGAFVDPRWLILPGFMSIGLIVASLTNFCGMGLLLAAAPWNKPKPIRTQMEAVTR